MNERSIFLSALDIPDLGQRAAYLDEACGGDPAVRRGVEELLAAHERSGSFMAGPAVGGATAPQDCGTPGGRIGPYKLLQQIGAGGMGVVFMAEQEEPVRRRVALKVIRPGLDSAQVIGRFEAERQALALMDHPNIAKVLDAGATPDGRPYFVMELIHGVPITRYCDELNLPLGERLALFVPVCRAVQHAHQRGILHRDLKPGNILVAVEDGVPAPKVIDFGVAKALHQRLTERTLYTEFGAVVGTLEYMSPEQAELSPLQVDTRADVYALGALLYELLTGSTPLGHQWVKEAAMLEVLRCIREEEPPPPSTRLTASGEQLAALAARRRTDPARLARAVRGELDWVVMRCLEKDRTRRYESAGSLASDVARYLADEPVEACPPSWAYRWGKAYRRHRAAALGAAAFVLLLVAATVTSLALGLQARRAAAQARQAEEAARQAEEAARQAEEAARQAEGELAGQFKATRAAKQRLEQELYVSRIRQSQAAIEAGDRFAALQTLERLRTERKWGGRLPFEWRYLYRQCWGAGASCPPTRPGRTGRSATMAPWRSRSGGVPGLPRWTSTTRGPATRSGP